MKRAPKDAKAALVQDENIASLGMLAAGLAHEINTPVGAIHSNNDILRRAISKLTTLLEGFSPRNARQSLELEAILSVLQQTCQVNETATERIMHVVRNLKDFARLDEAERKKFNIHEGLESTLGIMQHQFKNRIQLVKKYGDVPEIECSPNALNQVFMNILVNAAQAIPERGTITVRTSATETGVEIAISDTGEGIAPENMSRIFDPGFTTKGVGVGTGLGLSICYKIVAAHRGSIDVSSSLGKGSTFTVTIPSNIEKDSNHDRACSSDYSSGG